jgi:hypothetical protein
MILILAMLTLLGTLRLRRRPVAAGAGQIIDGDTVR